MQLRAHLKRSYLSRDSRSLGLFRVGFACVLVGDLSTRYGDLAARYGRGAAAVGVAGCALVYCGLGVGYRTRLLQALTLLCVVSMHTRIAPLQSGAGALLRLLASWTLFLPLGQRFSLDALLGSLRAHPELDAESLNQRSAMRARDQSVVSLAALAVLLQLFVVGLCERAPSAAPAGWTLAIPALGMLGAVLIASPVLLPQARLLALCTLLLLHLALALRFTLGSFPYAMIAGCALLLEPQHWAALARRDRAPAPTLHCFFDAQCGICFQVARVLARLDLFDRIEIIANDAVARLPPGVGSELVAQTLVAQNLATGRIYTEAHAVAALCRALPCGIVPWAVLEFPPLAPLWRTLYRLVAHNRTAISGRLGLAVCGVPLPKPAVRSNAADATEIAAATPRARAGRIAAESCVAILLLASAGEVLNHSAAVPSCLRFQQPPGLQAIIDAGGLTQAWSTALAEPLSGRTR